MIYPIGFYLYILSAVSSFAWVQHGQS